MQFEVTTWYLEMLDPQQFCPKWLNHPDLSVVQAEIPSPELSRFLYASVGGHWYWLHRLSWNYEQWMQYLNGQENGQEVKTWVAYVRGTPAGYVELQAQTEGNVGCSPNS
jgi:hypothetical protein